MDPEISVIIVNWNSKDYVRTCLHSLRENCSDLALQVIVVDGASYDGCEAMLRSEFPEAEYIQSKENIGFGRCNNLGAQSAKGKYLLLLNPDCEVKTHALQILLQEIKTLPNPGILGPRLLNTDGTLQTSCVQNFPTPINQAIDSEILRTLLPRLSIWGTHRAYKSKYPTKVQALSGASLFLSRALFIQLDGFSPQYFMYGEDIDLCKKALDRGKENYHIPNAEIIHHGGGSSKKQVSTFSTINNRIAIRQYCQNHLGKGASKRYTRYQRYSANVRLILLRAARTIRPSCAQELAPSEQKWKAVKSWTTSHDEKPTTETGATKSKQK